MRWILLLLLMAAAVTAAVAEKTFEVINLKSKVVEGPDSEGDLRVSVKSTVKNLLGEEQKVEVWIQALDGEGFEVVDVDLIGHFKPNEVRVLTNTVFVNKKAYETIVKWQVEE